MCFQLSVYLIKIFVNLRALLAPFALLSLSDFALREIQDGEKISHEFTNGGFSWFSAVGLPGQNLRES